MKFKSDIEIQAGVEAGGSTGSSGQVLSSTGSGVAWIDQSAITSASDFVFFNVKNETGSTILKGKGVMAVGTDGNSGHILVDEMVADGTVEAKYFLGVLEEDIANGAFARVISFGQLDQFNTTGQNGETWADGQILWCDPANPGDFTITEPDGPNVKIAAAFILNSSTNGKIQVRVQANEGIHDLHDTKITSQVDGDVLVWDNTTGVWFNDSTLNVDYTNGNVGIGTTSPDAKLEVRGPSNSSDGQKIYITEDPGLGAYIKYDGYTNVAYLGGLVFGTEKPIMRWDRSGTFTSMYTSGVERIRVDANGKVGIGTTTPSEKLDLGTSGAIKITQPNVTEVYVENTGIRLKNIYTGGGWARGILTYENSMGTDYFQIGALGQSQTLSYGYIGNTYNNNAFRWYQNNNVFIGNDLNITNNLIVGSTSTTTYRAEIIDGSLAVSETIGPTRIGIELKGNRLTSIPSSQTKGYIGVGDSAIGVTGDMLIAPRTDENASIRFITGKTPSEKVRIDGLTGNVGIGTTTPSEKLHINGNEYVEGKTTYKNPAGNSVQGFVSNEFYYAEGHVINSWGSLRGSSNNVLCYGVIPDPNTSGAYLSSANNVSWFRSSFESGNTFEYKSLGASNIPVGEPATLVSRFKIDNASGNVGIGTTGPSSKLDVYGTISLNGFDGLRYDTTSQSLYAGHLAGNNQTRSSAFGYQALNNNTGAYSNGFGFYALRINTGNFSNGFGYAALNNNTGDNSSGFGHFALANNTGARSSAFGCLALQGNSGSNNTAVGYASGYETNSLTGVDNTFLGTNASYGIATSISNSTALGANVTLTHSNTVILGNNANVGIGTTSPDAKLEVTGDVKSIFYRSNSDISTSTVAFNATNTTGGNLNYTVTNNRLICTGVFNSSSTATGFLTIATLPTGARPNINRRAVIIDNTGSGLGVNINTNGEVKMILTPNSLYEIDFEITLDLTQV
jgi:hypothetical protein